jgi:GTP-binding protein
MFIDKAELLMKAGHGGPGKVSFYNYPQIGPDGGNGGRGGDVYIKGTTDLTALRNFNVKRTLEAGRGEPGGSNRKFGKDGGDITVLLPIGSTITVTASNKPNAETEIIELTTPNEPFLFCKGGKGGRGNFEFKSPTNTTPEYAQPGLDGEEKHITIDLKLIADFGFVGLPNAGKSSLLNTLTSAEAKVADYPFTTLEPNLGVIPSKNPTVPSKIIADIPGLIEGASDGKGLGIKFLKHIERTKTLFHLVSAESDDVVRDYKTIRAVLGEYDKALLEKPEHVFLAKSDMIDAKELKERIAKLKKIKVAATSVTILDDESLEMVKKMLRELA